MLTHFPIIRSTDRGRGTFWRGDPDKNGMNVPEVVIERNRALEVAASDTFLTPAKARAMPDALLRAAAVMEGLG